MGTVLIGCDVFACSGIPDLHICVKESSRGDAFAIGRLGQIRYDMLLACIRKNGGACGCFPDLDGVIIAC